MTSDQPPSSDDGDVAEASSVDPDGLIIDETPMQPAPPRRGISVVNARAKLLLWSEQGMARCLRWHQDVERLIADALELLPFEEKERDRFVADLRKSFHSPQLAVRVTTGGGKSRAIRRMIARYIRRAKLRGLPHRVVYLVGTHALADEANVRMPTTVSTAVWQGRDSTLLNSSEPMCRNMSAVRAAMAVGATVEDHACRRKEARCPFYETCHYQAQKKPVRRADVVFGAHEILFQTPDIGKKIGLVVVDESFWQDGITTSARLIIASLDAELKTFPVLIKDKPARPKDGDADKRRRPNPFPSRPSINETDRLHTLINMLQEALTRLPDGYVQRQPLLDVGFLRKTAEADSSCAAAAKLEWRRKADTKLRPGATEDQQQTIVKKFGFLASLRRRVAMWKALDELVEGKASETDGLGDDEVEVEITGRLKIETVTTAEGSQRYLRLLGRKQISKKLVDLPMIHLDATLSVDLVRNFLPHLELDCDLEIDAPHMRIVQVTDLPVGKASLRSLEPGRRTVAEEERVGRKRARLVDVVRHLVRGRRGLVVTYKDIEDDYCGIEGLEVAHHGAIEGRDIWRDVDVIVVVGRPLPRPEDIQDMAAAVTGLPVVAAGMITVTGEIRAGAPLECRVYEVPEAELIRRAVSQAAVIQAVGRGRGVNRSAADPLEVYMVLGDLVTGLPVDEVVPFRELEPDAIDRMLDMGWEPQMPADAAKLFPDLFRSRNAAKLAYRRDRLKGPQSARLVSWPYRNISIRPRHQPPCVTIFFQPSGRGQLPRFCMVDAEKVPDPQAVLEAAWGPLRRFEMRAEPRVG